ncbi:GNAT family N-acetyltransferase [Streptomyces viridiviolaceus]
MTGEQHSVVTAALRVSGQDDDLEQRLDDELAAFNTAATAGARPEPLTVRVTDDAGEPVGGLTTWTRSGLCPVDLIRVREDQRHTGWGSRLMRAAEVEAVRRGCTDTTVSTYTFQAPRFSPGIGFRERGRVEGVPDGHQDVYFHKSIGASAPSEV